ncbi:YggN family protein [Vibrio sp. Of7-15]|uniref:DUF2884 family protein n=1 Tax=Vibrio sp. Of7-15 TaxID=2724879 RepID=UPI001EF1ABFC|nr:DUF2884 family protein [Vibrio sp. Of7-15]MCG7499018.1 YggN family protein [Vibrio sp. Of7-15]
MAVRLIRLFLIIVLALPSYSFSNALPTSECHSDFHNSFLIRAGDVQFFSGGHPFTVSPEGRLYFGVNPVGLDDQQTRLLQQYSQTLRRDLSVINSALSDQLKLTWVNLDHVLVAQFGADSAMRSELAQFHLHMQQRLFDIFTSHQHNTERLQHHELARWSQYLSPRWLVFSEQLVQSGLANFVNRAGSEMDPLHASAQHVYLFQRQFRNQLEDEWFRVRKVEGELCELFAQWQAQEEQIQSQIPALKQWSTVTVERNAI